MQPITLSIKEVIGNRLHGRVSGQRDFARICEELAGTPTGSIAILDFLGIPLVSGSWANAAIVPLIRWAADSQIDLYPVLLNANEESVEDIQLVAEWNHQTYLHASVRRGCPRKAVLLGSLDQGQVTTLRHVLDLREVTGAELERRADEPIRATAWNNRLKDLHSKRLLRRTKRGREQVYSPVVPEIVFNG